MWPHILREADGSLQHSAVRFPVQTNPEYAKELRAAGTPLYKSTAGVSPSGRPTAITCTIGLGETSQVRAQWIRLLNQRGTCVSRESTRGPCNNTRARIFKAPQLGSYTQALPHPRLAWASINFIQFVLVSEASPKSRPIRPSRLSRQCHPSPA